MTCAPGTGAPPMLTLPLRSVFGPVYGVVNGVGTTVRAAVAAGCVGSCGFGAGAVAIGVGAPFVAALAACPVASCSREARSCAPTTSAPAMITIATRPRGNRRIMALIMRLVCLALTSRGARRDRRRAGRHRVRGDHRRSTRRKEKDHIQQEAPHGVILPRRLCSRIRVRPRELLRMR